MSWCNSSIGVCPGGGSSPGLGVAGAAFAAALRLLVSSQCLLTEPWPQQANLPNGSSVDVIIVGAGSAGSALAARLAETNLTVLLLEAGGDPPLESIVPGFKSSLQRNDDQYDWRYTSTYSTHYSGQELMNHRQWLRAGKMLGGTGSLNAMIYSRSYPEDFNEWADFVQDSTWNWDNVLPYFKKTEKLTNKNILNYAPSQHYHGYDGEIEVAGVDVQSFHTVKFLEAFGELGINIKTDRNNPNKLGASYQSYTIKNGKRQSSLTAMLNKVAKKDNLFVMKNAFVTKILINDKATAYGVKVLLDGEEKEFYANKEVISSAGVFNTPKLLMLSGIGPKGHLDTLRIDVIKDLPVGSNLHDHSYACTFLAADSGTCPSEDPQFEVIKYLYNRTGSLSIPSLMGVDYALKNSSTPHVPDLGMFPIGCFKKGYDFGNYCLENTEYTYELCSHLDSINKEYDLFLFDVGLRRPTSRGTVRLTSANPFDKPDIYMGLFKNEDINNFVEAHEVLWSLTNTTYFRKKNAFVVDLKLKSCEGMEGVEKAKCVARSLVTPGSHATSTAAMGAVLDARLRVHGVRGLRVVDASAIPTALRANPNAAIIMIAEKAADFIKEELLLQ